jgi:hypothetical protein
MPKFFQAESSYREHPVGASDSQTATIVRGVETVAVNVVATALVPGQSRKRRVRMNRSLRFPL